MVCYISKWFLGRTAAGLSSRAYLKPLQSFVCALLCPCQDVPAPGRSCCPPVLPPQPQGCEHPHNTGWSWGALAIISVKRNPSHAQILFNGCFYSSMLFKQNTKQNGSPLSSACFCCSCACQGLFLTHALCICHTLLSTPQGSDLWCPSWLRNTRELPDPWLLSSWRDRQAPSPPLLFGGAEEGDGRAKCGLSHAGDHVKNRARCKMASWLS